MDATRPLPLVCALYAVESPDGVWMSLPRRLGVCGLVTLEHDLGTAIIIAGIVLGMLYIAGMNGRQVGLIAGLGAVAASGLIFSSSERMSRILSFLNPSADPQGLELPAVAVARRARPGRLVRGRARGRASRSSSTCPRRTRDMIFAILGEEFGLIGATLVILLFAAFARRLLAARPAVRRPHGKVPDRRVRYAGHSPGRRQHRRSRSERCP